MMKKRLFTVFLMCVVLCLFFTSCDLLPGILNKDQCTNHIYDESLTCLICGHKMDEDANADNKEDNNEEDNNEEDNKEDNNEEDNNEKDNNEEDNNEDNKNDENEGENKDDVTDEGFTVSFDTDGGTSIPSQKVSPGGTVTKPEDPEKDGCIFDGWYVDGRKWSFVGYPVTSDIVLTAKWSTCINYVLDGGALSNASPTFIFSDDKFPIALADPSKEGYIFEGWYSDPYFNNEVVSIDSFAPITLYARWTKDPSSSKYPWDTTTLHIRLTENSNHNELPSTCRRYLAGDLKDVDDFSIIDNYIAERNEMALTEANVEIVYSYLPDTAEYAWGENVNRITQEVMGKRPERPDIYSNFVYDMVAASLQGAFANLLSTTMYKDGHELAGIEHNYFEFIYDPMYVDSGEGYMISYMRSLTLSKYKMYLLASDYFIDLVRAEMVIPVNIGLLESLSTSDDPDMRALHDRVETLDRMGNIETNYTIEDLYQLVYDGDWSYETLAMFSRCIHNSGYGGEDIDDLRDTVGFAVDASTGLAASGLLYSSSVNIIDRVYDVAKGDYTYAYPCINPVTNSKGEVVEYVKDPNGTHDELIMFCKNLSELFYSTGVISVNYDQIFNYGQNNGDMATPLSAIRERFASGNVLFGGIVTLGSLEYNEYKEMNGKGKSGYGIVPVPLYRSSYIDWSGETKVDKYNVQFHNIGKIGAISYTTENFAQCTAYLNYQSTNSTHILNEYYDYKLQYDVVGTEVKGNVEMLKFIRANVHSGFDMTFEYALNKFYNATDDYSSNEMWHVMIRNAEFQLYDMHSQYESVSPKKALRLYNLENAIYPHLPS